jgi:hypothetical protein
MILRDAEQIKNHGPLLFHLMFADARDGDSVSVREGHRHVDAWLQRRKEHFEEETKRYPNSEPRAWPIDACDIAAQTEAVLRVAGPQQAVKNVLRWSPKSLALSVASILSLKLITSGEVSLVERCITEGPIRPPWDLFLLTPLALAGKNIALASLEFSLVKLLRRGLIRLDRLAGSWRDDFAINDYLETIVTACEIVVARGGDYVCVTSVLEQFAKPELRRRDRIYTSRVTVIDFTLRAYALLERLAGRKTSVETYLVDPPSSSEDVSPEKLEQHKSSDERDREEIRGFIGPLVEIYDIRAQALIGSISCQDAIGKLRDTIGSLNEHEYRFSMQYDSLTMRKRAALSISRLMAIAGLDRKALLECSISLLGSRPDPLGSGETEIFENLALDRSLHETILQSVTIRGKAVRELKAAAEEKVTALVLLARLLLPISFEDASACFNEAIEVAGEIDEEAIHEISLFAPLATRAVDSMNLNQRRAAASDLAIVVSDTAVRLVGHDHFPWAEVAEALATLDLPFALAAVGRWDDANIVGWPTFLPPLLETGLVRHEIPSQQVVALLPLLDKLSNELIGHMVTEANARKGDSDLNTLSEELAKEELLRFGHGIRKGVLEKLNSLSINGKPGLWLGRLLQATRFHQVDTPNQLSPTHKQEKTPQQTMRKAERKDPCDTIDWQGYRFVSAEEVEYVIGTVIEAARILDTYVSVSAILDKMRSFVWLGDRRAHLDALVDSTSSKVSDYELADAITNGVLEWGGTPAVDNWCRERLMKVVVEQLPGFSRFLWSDRRPLPELLKTSGVPHQQIAAALIEGLELHVDTLNAATIYALVGLVGRHSLHTEAAQVITRYVTRLVQRIAPSDREKWDGGDIPTTVVESMARYLYALMGDVDVRSRWRAAHVIWSLVRLGDCSVVDGLLRCYDRTSEASYRSPDAPFYWLAARLWLMITLDRISDEAPLALKSHGRRILKIASDDNFPHILVRAFAKSAVSKLVAAGTMRISSTQRKALTRANTSQVPRRKARGPSYNVGFDKYAYKQREERRFHFDTMDTLPYWYSGAMRRFADLDREKFLDAAEHWVVDRWGVRNNPRKWNQEPRRQRFSDRSVSSWHSHGSLPILERFHSYLEWHAMWCATGELMQRHALVKVEKNDYDTFDRWLSGEGLTAPPQWLADLRGAKPLESRFWFAPAGDIDAWIEDVGDNDFLTELELLKGNEMMVVEGHHETRSCEFMLSVQVRSALVSCDTAISLVRALQTVDDSWDYHIPLAGDDSEIDVFPYKLKGWIIDDRHDLGIDERDPFRYGVRGLEYCPSARTVAVLNLKLIRDSGARWVDAKSRRDTVFAYEAWGDNRGDEGERIRYDETVRSSGARLQCDKGALRSILNKTGLDLIVEIEITRRTKGYEYSRHDEEETKESKFDRVVLLRKDGTIESAEGCLGSWATPRT